MNNMNNMDNKADEYFNARDAVVSARNSLGNIQLAYERTVANYLPAGAYRADINTARYALARAECRFTIAQDALNEREI